MYSFRIFKGIKVRGNTTSFRLYNVCLSETREIGTKCTDGRNKTRHSRRIDENDINHVIRGET
jgi:hypothetical protein